MAKLQPVFRAQNIPSGARPRICLIALSAIADDPRVRRQGDAFVRDGWDVVAVGLPGARSTAPGWTILFRQTVDLQGYEAARCESSPKEATLPEQIPVAPVQLESRNDCARALTSIR
jgi:hypothetical protein